MKIALVHDWITVIGGAEKVLSTLYDIYPEAEIYCLVYKKEVLEELGIPEANVHASFIQKLPLGVNHPKIYLPLFPMAIESFNLDDYEVILSSSHCVAKGVLTRSDQLHICYCHSPMRYVWDLHFAYLKDAKLDKGLKSYIARHRLQKLRNWDVISSLRVDYFIANSNYIGKRIHKAYRRAAVTIYPPVETHNFPLSNHKEDFYLTASRLVNYKKVDVIIKAFRQMPDKKLIVIGSGPQLSKIKSLATPNITIMGYQPFETLRNMMSRAKAFIYAAEEDFGITPVEAQACGTPVIAFGKGGALETIIEGETGLFFNKQTPESIIIAVNEFEEKSTYHKFAPKRISIHAAEFDKTIFKTKIIQFVESKYNKKKPVEKKEEAILLKVNEYFDLQRSEL